MSDLPKSDELINVSHSPSPGDWMDTPVNIRKGIACHAGNPKSLKYVGLPNPRTWSCFDEDWQLPENWQQIIHEGFKERLED